MRDRIVARLLELRPSLEAKGVHHAGLFGSVARGDDVPESDVDIVLDFGPLDAIGLFQYSAIRLFLEEAIGREVDVATLRALQPGRHDEILAELYEVF